MATSDHPFSVSPGWRALRGVVADAIVASGVAGAAPVVALFDTRPPGIVPESAPGGDVAALAAALASCGLPSGRALGLGNDLLGVVVAAGGPGELQRLVEAAGRAPGTPAFAWGASRYPDDGASADDLLSVAVGRLGELRAAADGGTGAGEAPNRRRGAFGVLVACAALLGGVLLPVALTTGPNLFTAPSPHRGLAANGAHGATTSQGAPPPAPPGARSEVPPGTTVPPVTTSPPAVPSAPVSSLPKPAGGLEVGDGPGVESDASASPPPPAPAPAPAPTTTPTTAPPSGPSPTTTEPGDGGGGCLLLLCGH